MCIQFVTFDMNSEYSCTKMSSDIYVYDICCDILKSSITVFISKISCFYDLVMFVVAVTTDCLFLMCISNLGLLCEV